MIKYFYFLLLILLNATSFAQQVNVDRNMSRIREAGKLSQESVVENSNKIFDLYMASALEGSPQAMNMVGLSYKNGGNALVPDIIKAEKWLLKSAKEGNVVSYFHLGELFRTGKRENIDYPKAFKYYSEGAEFNQAFCQFEKAYMEFKGLGCQQNYGKAAAGFKQLAEKNVGNALFYYGICLRNGYGVQQNSDSAKAVLQFSIRRGSWVAERELKLANAEIDEFKPNLEINSSLDLNRYGQYRNIASYAGLQVLQGTFDGHLLTYDYSGNDILRIQPISIKITNNDTLLWTEKDSATIAIPFNTTGNKINFSKKELMIPHRYKTDKTENIFEFAVCNVFYEKGEIVLEGNLFSYIPEDENESQKPQYFVLRKTDKNLPLAVTKNVELEETFKLGFQIFPNPVRDKFTIISRGNNLISSVSIITAEGKVVYSKRYPKAIASRSIRDISTTNLSGGIYLLKIDSNSKTSYHQIVKLKN